MPKISLTRLVDFVSKSGAPKQTSAAVTKQQLEEGYDPATDFWRILREAIVASHEEHHGKSYVQTVAASVHDRKRAANYPALAKAYTTWWGRKNIDWFTPPSSVWEAGNDFEVTVNPELGLDIDGERHVVKLYFKSEKVTKNRIEIVSHLMMKQFANKTAEGTRFSVLDIRNRKLHTIEPPSYWGPLLRAEMAHLAALWPHL